MKVITAASGNTRDSQSFKLQLVVPLDIPLGTYSGTLTFSAETP